MLLNKTTETVANVKDKIETTENVFRSGFTTLVLPLITSDEELVAPGALYAGIVFFLLDHP